MSKEVKAAIVTGVFGIVAAILTGYVTWYFTDRSSQQEKQTLEAQRKVITNPQGTYIWEAIITHKGDRWKGEITVDEHGTPELHMRKVEKCPNNPNFEAPLLKQDPGGQITIPQQGKLHIHIPVRFLIYDKPCVLPSENPPTEPPTILDGDIDQTTAYIGRIWYQKRDPDSQRGGMILVKDISGLGAGP